MRILHNGMLRKDTREPSPHWMVHVYDNGNVWGEVLTMEWGRTLPKDFQMPDKNRFFEIPAELRQHQLAKHPHHEEIIVTLVTKGGYHECSFLMSQLTADSSLRFALNDLLQRVQEFIKQTDFEKNKGKNI